MKLKLHGGDCAVCRYWAERLRELRTHGSRDGVKHARAALAKHLNPEPVSPFGVASGASPTQLIKKGKKTNAR